MFDALARGVSAEGTLLLKGKYVLVSFQQTSKMSSWRVFVSLKGLSSELVLHFQLTHKTQILQ